MALQVQSNPFADRAWVPQTCDIRGRHIPTGPAAKRAVADAQLPDGFPGEVYADMAWSGERHQNNPKQYEFHLEDDDINELELAVFQFKVKGLELNDLSTDTFVLPHLGSELRKLARQIHHGRGFFVLKGLNPKRYSDWDNAVIYAGISSYIGNRRGRQDEYGNMLLHLTDLGSGAAPDNERQAPYSSVSQPFHTDTGSILGLYCKGKASVGGESKLASSWHIYNEMLKTRPDLVRVLSKDDWAFDSFGLTPAYSTRPVLHLQDGKLILSFARRPLVGSPTSPRSANIPELTEQQVEALNMIQSIADSSCITFNLDEGDCLFWNNLGLLHSRAGFTDTETEKRHLMRIWLHSDSDGWTIPSAIKKPWTDSFGEAGPQPIWPLSPIADREYISTQQRASGHS